jgi:hypothetical protein
MRAIPLVKEACRPGIVHDAEPRLVRGRVHPAAPANDLLEKQGRGQSLHKDDVAAGGYIHAGGQQFRGGGYHRHYLVTVLELLQDAPALFPLFRDDRHGIVVIAQVAEGGLEVLSHQPGVGHVHAKDHGAIHRPSAVQQTGQMVAHRPRAVGQRDLPLKLGRMVDITQIGPLGHIDLGPLHQRVLDVQAGSIHGGADLVHFVGR